MALRDYPGFCLSVVGLVAALGLVVVENSTHNGEVSDQVEAIEIVTRDALAAYAVGGTELGSASAELRKDVMALLLTMRHVVLRNQRGGIVAEEYDQADKFLRSLDLDDYFRVATASNIDTLSSEVAERARRWLNDKWTESHRSDTYSVWGIIALLYALIVGFGYFGAGLSPDRGEAVLNIVDVGLYLTLLEISGGFKSPILLLLSLSVLVAGLDARRALITNFRGRGWELIRAEGWQKLISSLAPTLLYLFALFSGLFWATVPSFYGETQPGTASYLEVYLRSVSTILLVGLSSAFILTLVIRFVRAVDLRQEKYVPGR